MVTEKKVYVCDVCGAEYPAFDSAVSCEARSTKAFKFPFGLIVSVVSKGDLLPAGREYKVKIVRRLRCLEGVLHTNWYEVEFLAEPGVHGLYKENEVRPVE